MQGIPAGVGRSQHQENVEYLYASLKQIYKKSFLPLEEYYSFADFFSPTMSDNDIDAKPFVLLLGQYSVGKTSFINHLLGDRAQGYPDRFMAIMHGKEDRVLPGNAVAVSPGKPFRGLQIFGNAFLQKFQCAEMKSEILESMTLIDTPGVLSGEKQRIGRNYDMSNVCKWFAERSDLILILFDAHKLDISDELKTVIESLRGHDDKIRIVLNKADQVNPQQLMRVYGALMWSLGKVFKTPEVSRVYISSFWRKEYSDNGAPSKILFDREKEDLFRDLRDIPKNAAVRRVNELVKRARTAKVHSLVCACLRKMMPGMFGKEKKQKELLANLEIIFQAVAQEHGISPGDFPDADTYREKLTRWTGTGRNLSALPKLNKDLVRKLDDCLANDIPALLRPLAMNSDYGHGGDPFASPFATHSEKPAQSSAFMPSEREQTEDAIAWANMARQAAGKSDEDGDGDAAWEGVLSRPGTAQLKPGNDRSEYNEKGGMGGMGGYTEPQGHQPPAKAPPPMPPTKAVPPPPQKAKMVRAKHGYTKASDGELSMQKGDEIRVTEEDDTGWWKGVLRGEEGWFPYNYVEELN